MLSHDVNYVSNKDSDVYSARLDLSKAFDSINHRDICVKLIEVGEPYCSLNIAINYYRLCVKLMEFGVSRCILTVIINLHFQR